jgi:hypothetical protein
VTIIFRASALSGEREGLARKSSREQSDSVSKPGKVGASQVAVVADGWPVSGEYFAGVFIYFREPDRLESGTLRSQCEASDAGEKVEVCEFHFLESWVRHPNQPSQPTAPSGRG